MTTPKVYDWKRDAARRWDENLHWEALAKGGLPLDGWRVEFDGLHLRLPSTSTIQDFAQAVEAVSKVLGRVPDEAKGEKNGYGKGADLTAKWKGVVPPHRLWADRPSGVRAGEVEIYIWNGEKCKLVTKNAGPPITLPAVDALPERVHQPTKTVLHPECAHLLETLGEG